MLFFMALITRTLIVKIVFFFHHLLQYHLDIHLAEKTRKVFERFKLVGTEWFPTLPIPLPEFSMCFFIFALVNKGNFSRV